MNTLYALLQTVAAHGDTPAIIALRKRDIEVWSCTRLADCARRLASGLAQAGLLPGTRVLLIAPNSPEWIVTCLALLAATAVPVPVDAQLGDNELRHVLHDSTATWVVTTQALAHRLVALGLSPTATIMLLDAPEDDPRQWRRYLGTIVTAATLDQQGVGEQAHERIATGLHACVERLGQVNKGPIPSSQGSTRTAE